MGAGVGNPESLARPAGSLRPKCGLAFRASVRAAKPRASASSARHFAFICMPVTVTHSTPCGAEGAIKKNQFFAPRRLEHASLVSVCPTGPMGVRL